MAFSVPRYPEVREHPALAALNEEISNVFAMHGVDGRAFLASQQQPGSEGLALELREPVERLLAVYVDLMLAVQLTEMRATANYRGFTPTAVLVHAYRAILRLAPTDDLSASQCSEAEVKFMSLLQPWQEVLQLGLMGRRPLAELLASTMQPLTLCGFPLLVLEQHRQGAAVNDLLARLGSPLRIRVIHVTTEPELLLAEPNFAKSTATEVFVSNERARTALLPYQLCSTQDVSSGNGMVIYREDAMEFLARTKWNRDAIMRRERDHTTYVPTQQAVLQLWRQGAHMGKTLGMSRETFELTYARNHLLESSIHYQKSEARLSTHAFDPETRGLLHALALHFPHVADMRTLLVDTIGTRFSPGYVTTIASGEHGLTHLLMYATDAWFGASRLYTAGALGLLSAALDPSGYHLDPRLLAREVVPRTAEMLTKLLVRMGRQTIDLLHNSTFLVGNQSVNFEKLQAGLRNNIEKSGRGWDFGSVEFEVSFWAMLFKLAMVHPPTAAAIGGLVHSHVLEFLAVMTNSACASVEAANAELFQRWARFIEPMLPCADPPAEMYLQAPAGQWVADDSINEQAVASAMSCC